MVLKRWDPLRDLLSLQERMNRLFEESLVPGRLSAAPVRSASWVPLADLYETAEAFIAQIELPGVPEDDVEVHVAADELEVRGVRRPRAGRGHTFYRMERSYGPFVRTFKLTETVDPDRVSAQFRDGLLRLELPKTRGRAAHRTRGERE